MSRTPAKFKQADVTRAIRALVAAGVQVKEVEISADGNIRLKTDSADNFNGAAEPQSSNENDFGG